MTAKRALTYGGATPASNAKRLRTLARQVARNKGELKCRDIEFTTTVSATTGFVVYEFSAIGQGDNIGQRDANRVTIAGLSVRWRSVYNYCDGYITLSPHGTDIATTDFQGIKEAYLNNTAASDHKILHKFISFNNGEGTPTNFAYKRRFKTPIPVHYNATTSNACVQNKMKLVFRNLHAANDVIHGCAKCWYYDK